MKIFSALSICLVLFLLAGCGKNIIDYGETEKIRDDQAFLKINYVSMYANNRTVYFKINDQRVSNVMTARTPFPGGAGGRLAGSAGCAIDT